MASLTDVWRVVRATKNWYSIIPVLFKIRKRAVIEFKNGLKLFYSPRLFSIEHFLEQPYRLANVEGRDVVDIGASNGDSSIYFAWKGAKRVFAFEPIPASYEMMKENILLNEIQNIEAFNEAVGLAEGEVFLDKRLVSFGGYSLGRIARQSPRMDSDRVHVKAFTALVADLHLEDAVLKMDCEGCEYDILLHIGDDTLSPFTQILLEYHRGFNEIVERLKKSGYASRLYDIKGNPSLKPKESFGLLYANRT